MLTTLKKMSFGTVLVVFALQGAASESDIRNSIALGALVFADNCKKCHQTDGYGETALYPSLHNPKLLSDSTLLIQTILNGRMGHQQEDGSGAQRLMPALGFLTNREIASIIAFITNSWGDNVLMVTDQEVEDARSLAK